MGEQKRTPKPPANPVIHTTFPDEDGRLRLNLAILDGVGWLKDLKSSAPIDCIIRIGSERQIVITPVSSLDESALAGPETESFDVARYIASRWEVRLSAEPTKRRREFTLPRALRLLGVVPKSGEETVIFAFGDRLEIWRGDSWIKHVAEIEKRREAKQLLADDE